MNAHDIIRQVQDDAGEWLEHSENPDAMVSGILANRIIDLLGYIEYLEKRVNHASSTRVN